jgi:hypothetical protein
MTKEIEKAERDLNNLEEQRESLFSRAKTLSKQRDAIAFAALTAGDKQSKEKLREINLEDVGLAANVASVEAALVVARSNLATAKQVEASTADHEQASLLQKHLLRFVELGAVADDAAMALTSSIIEMKNLREEMERLGVTAPTGMQFQVNGLVALKTMLQGDERTEINRPGLPRSWVRDLGSEWSLLLPNQKRSFRTIVGSWHEMISRQIAARMPVDKKDAA